MANLRAVFIDNFVDWALVAGTSRRERSRRDVVCKQFSIHDIDHGWYELLNILAARDECINVAR